jgi:DNA-binding MarR family transcriptional regulator
MKFLKLFAGLKKKREFERQQLTFMGSLVEFDIVIEIGYAQEQKKTFTPKQLFLLKIASDATVRRRLAKLTEQNIITRSTNRNDRRSDFLTLAPGSVKVLDRYGGILANIATTI